MRKGRKLIKKGLPSTTPSSCPFTEVSWKSTSLAMEAASMKGDLSFGIHRLLISEIN